MPHLSRKHPVTLSYDEATGKMTMISLVKLIASLCVCVWSLSASLSLLTGHRETDWTHRVCVCMCGCVCVCVYTVCAVHRGFPKSPIDKTWGDSIPLISLLDQKSDQCCCLLAKLSQTQLSASLCFFTMRLLSTQTHHWHERCTLLFVVSVWLLLRRRPSLEEGLLVMQCKVMFLNYLFI